MNSAGAAAEKQAAQFLRRQGLALIEANYRCRFGEIDLIMRDGAALVFIEVRLRRRGMFGGAAESITWRKQQCLLKTAQHYLRDRGNLPLCRFDAVLLEGEARQRIEWIKNAFGA
ncbi:MAG TPA: YraN family protein [Betaproteobacteria bacterium]|nr:YraN family protein [Betaproteobacteria bacterium]